jgi:Rha family phage regulatory protein
MNIQKVNKHMSSREIAELTGKRHDNVKRDIVKMFADLKLDALKFEHTYQDSQNRQQTEYLLPKDETLCLLAGYDAQARMKIIKRWQELEQVEQASLPVVKDPQLAAMVTMLTQLDAVKQEQQSQRQELENI